ncbi:MAG: DNA translocase FtsK 4TM domain-containing protein [Verrucomicrobiota bacterium]
MVSSRRRSWNEVTGLLLFFGGVLLLLALCSFEPRDVSSWLPYAKYAHSSDIPLNFIGRVGANVSGLMYFLFGAASYFGAVALLGLGVAKFTGQEFQLGIRLGWAFVFVLSWSTLLDLQHLILLDWKEKFNIQGPGGWFGHRLNLVFGRNVLGSIGSMLIFMALAMVSLILATGFHPILAMRRGSAALISLLVLLFRVVKNAMRPAAAESTTDVSSDVSPVAAVRSRRRRTPLAEDEVVEEEAEVSVQLSADLPAPKIIDASVPAPARKPSLAEVMKSKEKAKSGSKALSTNEGGLSEVSFEEYNLPSFDLLETYDDEGHKPADPAELQGVQKVILDTLAQFDIEASPGDITKGPTITRYEVYPAIGVRVERISALEKNLARATRAERINILAPIPGKDTVGIEIANSSKVKVSIRELFESEAWESSKAALPLALGKDVYGHAIIADLAAMPHLLVAGATGSGKSVCINSIITSLIFKHTPETLRFIMIDPKVVEMQVYNDLPHLVTPVVTDSKKVLLALRWVVDEMEKRYAIFAKVGVKNISGFNSRPRPEKSPSPESASLSSEESPESSESSELDPSSLESAAEAGAGDALLVEEEAPEPVPPLRGDDEMLIPDQMPFIVVIVDELADLMQTAPADVEGAIARITQKARAAGIHMIVATQTPRSTVVTGVIKANIPSRIAFQVASGIDSRVILDTNGAERLLGKGDMLYLPPGSAKLTRAQGVLVTDEEIHRVVANLAAQSKPVFEPSISAKLSSTIMPEDEVTDEEEDLVDRCLEIIRQEKKASTSMLQRRLRLGYTRAARIVDILEQRGILGPKDGAKDREILVDLDGLDDTGGY